MMAGTMQSILFYKSSGLKGINRSGKWEEIMEMGPGFAANLNSYFEIMRRPLKVYLETEFVPS
jgi:hypothetical protein